jgi:hypothetical protein
MTSAVVGSRASWEPIPRSVLVVAPYPQGLGGALVASRGCPVEQAVVGHRELEAAGGRHVGPVDGAVRERTRSAPAPP